MQLALIEISRPPPCFRKSFAFRPTILPGVSLWHENRRDSNVPSLVGLSNVGKDDIYHWAVGTSVLVPRKLPASWYTHRSIRYAIGLRASSTILSYV